MKRTHGLISLATLHNVTSGLALLLLLGHSLNPGGDTTLLRVLQLCAFGFFSVIVRRAWASIDGGSEGMSPGKAQGFLWIPFFNFYWVFPALVSLATQTNAKSDSEQNPAGRITRGFGLVSRPRCRRSASPGSSTGAPAPPCFALLSPKTLRCPRKSSSRG
jgi:hypothetical protein